MTNVILAAHIASASPTAVQRLRENAVNTAVLGATGKAVPNIVNGVKPAV
jgi:lactate dehydrogenase-like 2-hydroxyacid dehydrogenase